MKKIFLLIAFLTIFGQTWAAWDCLNPPKDIVRDTNECCSSPEIVPDTVQKECTDKYSSEPRELQKQCLMSTCMIDKLDVTSNGNFVEQKAMDLIKRTVTNDPFWETAMEDVSKGCIAFAQRNLEKGKDMFKTLAIDISDVTKCNPMYMIFLACMEADLLTKCPDHSFMQVERCQNWKTYATDCADDNLYLIV